MRVARRVLRCVACCALLGLVWCSVTVAGALGAGTSAAGASGSSRGWIGGQPLLVPEVDRLLGGAQSEAAWLAGRSGPGAFAVRRASGSSFMGLSSARAAGELGRAFPGLVAGPAAAGGAVSLPAGARLLRYRTDGAAEIAVGHRRAIVESVAPLAARIAGGRRAPIDLSLTQAGGQYVPVRSEAHVGMPTSLSRGVSLSEVGVSLTPVDAHGRSLTASAGTPDGGSVVWRDSEAGSAGVHDLVTVARPSAVGFDLSSVLLSQRSPGLLYFRVGVPSGARLQIAKDGSVSVVRGGRTLASIPPSVARDAEGTAVPVSTAVRGNTIVLSVGRAPGDYMYPIVVDPEMNDTQLATTTGGKRSNWQFYTSNPSYFAGSAVYEGAGKGKLETKGIGAYAKGEWAYWGYETQGNSKLYEIKTETSANNRFTRIESFLEFLSSLGQETTKRLSSEFEPLTLEYEHKASTLCAANAGKEECLPAAGKEKNAVHFEQRVEGLGYSKYNFWDTMTQGIVSISEPSGTHSTTSYNTASPELEFEGEIEGKRERVSRKNALYGSGSWISKYEGALELIAKDPGIGVAATKLEYESSPNVWTLLSKHEYLEKENDCQGVQCYPEHKEFWTFDPKLPNGEDKIRYRAEEAMAGTTSLESEGQTTIKVDNAKPHGLALSGLLLGNEMAEKPYEATAKATDGEGSSVASSGIKSISLYIDGSQFGSSGGSCSVAKGECTASMKWTVNGAELGAGHHSFVVVAFDNAGNEERFSETVNVRHSTPVALGPGSVDLQSGDYALGATDVSMGSGLTVSRNYSSRNLQAGIEGPLGPQWSLNLGTTQSLVEVADGSMMLTDANGQQSIFASLGEGKYESPLGDANLKLTLEENAEKVKLAYYLEDAAKHTKTKFTLPSGGTKVWAPTIEQGTVATDTVTYAYQTVEQRTEYALPSGSKPFGAVKGPDGQTWFTNYSTNKIGKITTWGSIVEYALPSGSGPIGIAAGTDGNMWFANYGSSKIGKITTSGSVTEYALPSGSSPYGIVAGPDGNLWFADDLTSKIGRITTSGTITEYTLPSGSGPLVIVTGSDNNLWFTDNGSSKVGKITTSGSVVEYALPSGSRPVGIVAGADGNLWFADQGTSKISKATTTGTITEYALPSGSEPEGMAAGPDGDLWFTDYGTSKVGKIATSGSVREYALPSGSGPVGIATGPDNNLWFGDYTSSEIGQITTSGTITEPSEALAPVPAGVSCVPMKAGCRSLKFSYSTETTTTGEGRSEWGQYKGRLNKVLIELYNPSTKAMQETNVAEYSYDKQGRLRAEWDPRISPALKTTYGYDEEGHVTAMDPPGQEPWAFTYGAISGDAGTGRLLKAMRAPALTPLWGGEITKNMVLPNLSGKASIGTRMTVSDGSWTASPVAYAYQWKDCNSFGLECTRIAGATNPNYTPGSADIGHTLVAQVAATNGGGTTVAVTAASAVVPAGMHAQTVDSANRLNAVACVPGTSTCVVSDNLGKAFYATSVSASVDATWNAWSGPGTSPSEALSCPTSSLCLLAAGEKSGYGGNLYYATSLGGVWTQAYSPSYGVDAISCASSSFCVDGQDNLGYFRYSTNPPSTSWTLESQGSATMKSVSCPSSSFCATADSAGNVHVATSTAQIESSSWTETKVNGTSALNGIVCTSTTSCVAVDGAGNVLNLTIAENGTATATKQNIDGTNSLTAIACRAINTVCVSVDNKGNIFVSTNSGASWKREYAPGGNMTSVSCPLASLCMTIDTVGQVFAFNPTGGVGQEGELRSPQPGSTLEYDVPLSGGSGLPNMTSGEVAKWGQSDNPVEATAILPPDSPQGWPAASYSRATTYYLDEQGQAVNVSSPSSSSYGSISTTEYEEETNDVLRTLSPDNRVKALEAGLKSVEEAKLLSTYDTYRSECSKSSENNHERPDTEAGTRLCETEGPQHMVKYMAGKEQKEELARDHVKYFYDENVPTGEPYEKETYNLVTETRSYAELSASGPGKGEEVEGRITQTSYSGQSNLGWKLRAPTSVTVEPAGVKSTSSTFYNSTTGQVTETRAPAGQAGESAHDTRTIYYSSEANTEGFSACSGHPEWSGLVCETLPAKQPNTVGVPNLPVTTTTFYNIWNEPKTITETFGSLTRTKQETYDAAGRLASSETTSTEGKALPAVKEEYNAETGVLEKQNTTVEGKTQTLTSKYDKLGRMVEYSDADGNIANYRYGGPENDGLIEEMTDGAAGGTAKQTYGYNSTTKQLEELTDSAAGRFTASYDAEGKLVSEVYPNGMCANTSYNAVGEATHIEYIKTTVCSEKPTPWFSETRTPSVRGETFARSSTLASETYGYDTLGRLTETQETPAGEGCSERIYAYDEESNRTSLTKRAPGTGGVCASEGGTVEAHTYDEGNRLTDAGIEYDGFGNIKKLPAVDAEGHELTSTYYVDNAVASQSQNGVSHEYKLDPAGRVRETLGGVTPLITHYDGSGEAVAWTSESTEKWTRDIPGIDGTLSAVQTNGAAPVLQLHDLEGNVTATAELNKESTKLLSTYNSTEFGVPNKEKAPPKYAWLGAGGIESAFSSGVVTYGSTSYVPQTGRALQSEQVEPPGLPGGSGAGAAYVSQEEPWNMQGAAAQGADAPGVGAASEQTAAEEAQSKAKEAIGEELEADSGGEASISTRPSCNIHWLLDEVQPGTLGIVGWFKCQHPVYRMWMWLCIWYKHPNESWAGGTCVSEHGSMGVTFKNTAEGEERFEIPCYLGIRYTGEMYAHEWAKGHSKGGTWFHKAHWSRFDPLHPRTECTRVPEGNEPPA